MEIDFLGVGWTSPVKLDENGQIQMASYEDVVRQSIMMILNTATGERVMRPNFGCGIHDKIFAPNNATTVGEIIADVQNALVEWEPRIQVLSVEEVPDSTQPNVILIQVTYQILTTNSVNNLVYPFYLM